MAKPKKASAGATLAANRKASHEFHLLQRFEAGIVLTGPEVKSARAGKVSLKEAYARIRNSEVFLVKAHFSPYLQAGRDNADPIRTRKLLLHAREIRKLSKATETAGMALVPTRLYLKNGKIKIEIALARGKKLYDKRESLRKREVEREIERAGGSRSTG